MNYRENFIYGSCLLILVFLCGLIIGMATEFMLLSIGLILTRFVALSKIDKKLNRKEKKK